jgi:predicted ATPase/class 3 adenylate cyclase
MSDSAGDGGRITATRSATAIVLFTDVVGSTELRSRLGDDAADEVRRVHDQLLREAVSARGGVVVKGTGDGLMAVFDAATEAVAAGVAMQQATRRYAMQRGLDVEIRIGISAGDVSWEGNDCFGTPVVEAARLCDAAGSSTVLISEIVRLLAGSRGRHTYQSPRSLQLKGLADTVTAHEVAWQALSRPDLELPRALQAPAESVPFVGREHAHDALVAAWKEASSDRRRAVLVSGEPGIGKTRLVSELARRVHGDGATVLVGRCDEELGVPYQPFAEALAESVQAWPADQVRDHLGAHAADLVRLVPDLADLLPGLGEPLRGEPETERYRLFEAFDLFLATTSGIAPVVLVLDDLHWAEQPTLLLLRHLARSTRAARVLIVGTYRDTDLGRSHPLAEMLADLRREPSVERLDLGGLDADEVAAFMRAAAGHDLDEVGDELARRLHAETDGNPFFVGQVLRNLAESGALVQEGGRWVPADAVTRLPEGVREVIGRRLSRLPDATTDVLELAAVVGREFDDRVLIDAAEMDGDAVFDALERAEAAHLIEPVRGARARHAFVHALVRSTLNEELPTTRRLRLHRRVGEALEPRAHDDSVLPDLARHFAEAAALGDEAKAARYGMLAARDAVRRLAYEEAARLCELAIGALEPGDRASDDVLADLLLELQQATAAAGHMDRTFAITERVVEVARRTGRPEVLAQAALSRNGWRRFWADAGVVDEELVVLLEEALTSLPADAHALRARCQARLAAELYFDVARSAEREQLITDAEALARSLGDRDVIIDVLTAAQWVRWRPGMAKERLAEALELEAIAEAGSKELRAANMGWRLGIYLETFNREKFDATVAMYVAAAEELGQRMHQWWSHLGRGTQALLAGRFADAETIAEESLQLGTQWPTAPQMYGVQMLAIRRFTGGIAELEPMTAALVEQFPLVPAWRVGLCFIYTEIGRLDDARAQLEVLTADGLDSIPFDANWHVAMALVALTAQHVGDAERSAGVYERLLPHAEVAVLAGTPADCLGSMRAYIALAAAGCGRWDEWERFTADARRHHEMLRSPSLLARWSYEEARVAAGRGDRERAEAAVTECVTLARPMGAHALVEKAEHLLA